jgi:hypothetical protein
MSLRVTPQRCGAVQSEINFNRVIANGVKQSLIAAIPNFGKETASTGKACPEHSEWERQFRNDIQ